MATAQAFKEYIVRFRKGERIYSAGDPGAEMYIVQSGSVEIFTEQVAGARRTIAVMEKGDFFGEMALIESVPHSSCAAACADCELLEINSTLFDRMIKGNIEIAVRILRKLSIRLREATRRIEELSDHSEIRLSADMSISPVSLEARGMPETGEDPIPPIMPAVVATTVTLAPGRPAPSPKARPRPADCHAVLQDEEGIDLFHLVSNRAAIGRIDPVTGLKPEVDLSAIDLNRSVSRHHARLTRENDSYAVTEEVGALNGTFINGRKLVSGIASPIKDGDVLNLGMVKLVFRSISG